MVGAGFEPELPQPDIAERDRQSAANETVLWERTIHPAAMDEWYGRAERLQCNRPIGG